MVILKKELTMKNIYLNHQSIFSYKAAADMLIMAWGRTHKVPYMIVRPTNNYGIGQYVEKLIPKAVKLLTLGRKIPLHNHGTPYQKLATCR
jgi:dTDP-D-glucose 4,6-dehydratase